jgi:hypothetical protein
MKVSLIFRSHLGSLALWVLLLALGCAPEPSIDPRWVYTDMGWFPSAIRDFQQTYTHRTAFAEEYRTVIIRSWNGQGQITESRRLDAVFPEQSDEPGQWLERSYRRQVFNEVGDLTSWEIGSLVGNPVPNTRNLERISLEPLPQWVMKTTQWNPSGRPLIQEAYLGADASQGFSFGKALWEYQGEVLRKISSPDNFPLSTNLNLPVESIAFTREGEKITSNYYGPGDELVYRQTRDRYGRFWAEEDPYLGRNYQAFWEGDDLRSFQTTSSTTGARGSGQYHDSWDDSLRILSYTWYSPLYQKPLQLDYRYQRESSTQISQIDLSFPGEQTMAILHPVEGEPGTFQGTKTGRVLERGEFAPFSLKVVGNGLPQFFGEYGYRDDAGRYLIRSVAVVYGGKP